MKLPLFCSFTFCVLSQRLSASQFSQAMSKETFSAHFFDESKTSCKRAAISKHAVSSKSLFPGLPIIWYYNESNPPHIFRNFSPSFFEFGILTEKSRGKIEIKIFISSISDSIVNNVWYNLTWITVTFIHMIKSKSLTFTTHFVPFRTV